MRHHRTLLQVSVGLAALLLAAGSAAEAGPQNFNQLLKGDYAFAGEAVCLVSPDGFNANLTPVGPPAAFPSILSFSVEGIRTFNGDGTGHVAARVVSVSHPNVTPTAVVSRGGANSSDVEADFTYEVAPDLSVAVNPTVLTGTFLAGPRAGQTFTVTNFPAFIGLISKDHKALTVSHVEPAIETQTFSDGTSQDRICHRSRILLELKGGS